MRVDKNFFFFFFGCFFIQTNKSSTLKLGSQILLKFKLTQHSRDEKLMQSLVEYFECGKYYSAQRAEYGDFIVIKLSDHINKIIPFFLKNKILNKKLIINTETLIS